MTTRWQRFYQKQMEDAKLRGLVGKRAGESAIGSADRQAEDGGESEPDEIGGESGDEARRRFRRWRMSRGILRLGR